MWLIAFRNHLTEAASISNRGTVEGLKALPLDEKWERLNQWILVAVAAFKAANDDLGQDLLAIHSLIKRPRHLILTPLQPCFET